jgi:hypothetical protein
MNLWLKIKILLGIKMAICKKCKHHVYINGHYCTRWTKKEIDYLTGEHGESNPKWCAKINTNGRCLGFEEVVG